MSTPEEVAEELLAKGRAYVRQRAPYVSKTLLGLVPVPTYSVETMGVTKGLVLYYNPLFFVNEPSFHTVGKDGLPNGHECVGGCLYHECWHPLRGLERLEALPDGRLANIAGDICIDHDLRVANWTLPPWVMYPETFGVPPGLTLEQTYHFLQNDKKAQEVLKKLLDQKPGEGSPRIGPCSGQCGGIGGNAVDKKLEQELDAKYGRHAAERDQIRQATIRDIEKHVASTGMGRGTVAGYDGEKVEFKERLFEVNWHKELSLVMAQATGRVVSGGSDYSYSRPSKRSMLLGVIRPGLIDQILEIAFIRDTSGSMGQEQLNDANNVAVIIMKKLGLDEVWLLDADMEVQRKPTRVRLKDIPEIPAAGRGGTSFIQPLEEVCKLKPMPDLCVYLTDGDGEAPEAPPRGLPVVWVIVPTPNGRRPAPWGHVVVCSNDQKLRAPYTV